MFGLILHFLKVITSLKTFINNADRTLASTTATRPSLNIKQAASKIAHSPFWIVDNILIIENSSWPCKMPFKGNVGKEMHENMETMIKTILKLLISEGDKP